MNLPLSASDLHEIAEALDLIETDEKLTSNPIIGRIEVIRPGGDDPIGYFEQEGEKDEAWYGFVGLAPFTFHGV
jgi:hypothetical protein